MTPVAIPARLRDLLATSEFEAPTIELAEAVGTAISERAMPFFPAYTDHGTEHVDRVLSAADQLIPAAVWEAELLGPADAAVLSCATMLHDLAMHVHEAGFVELVASDTRFEPQPWFSEDRVGRKADLPWPDLWASFQREARHFGTSQIELILGARAREVPVVAFQEELDPDAWTQADRLLVGEFLRRHHARLSHEIAQHGLPGTDDEDFPVLAKAKKLSKLANVIGATARSHNEPLRQMVDYLEYLQPGGKRPAGALVLYHMGLLRVADYLQLDADRAPPLLLRLKAPQSQLSIEEWNKHKAISSITWDHDDPRAIVVEVSPDHGLRTHLALADLFHGMQQEMDTTTAVLAETFGSGDLAALDLARRRVVTNLDEPSLHAQLPYLARRAALRSDPDLFRLVIGDLYGKQPAVAGRELIQNAVDAVRARRAWDDRTGTPTPDDQLRDLAADVVVTLEEKDDGACVLRVADRGIGMDPGLVVNYFLQAGASFGPSLEEIEDGDEAAQPMKAGRFGVGAFAAFLLGPEMRVSTRHVDEDRGVTFSARIDGDLVKLDWADVPIGTEVVIPFKAKVIPTRRWDKDSAHGSPEELLKTIAGFYRLRDPGVAFFLDRGGMKQPIAPPADVPAPKRKLPDRWRNVRVKDLDAAMWRVPKQNPYASDGFHATDGGLLAHNGILIGELAEYVGRDEGAFGWSDGTLNTFLRRPSLAVFDRRHVLGVALHRYGLVDPTLPFESQLLESVGSDLVAHALAAGADSHPLQARLRFSPVFSRTAWMPLLPALLRDYADRSLLILWHYDDVPYWLPDTPPSTESFVAARGTLPWRAFPHRAYLALDQPRTDDGNLDELQEWGHSLQAISRAVEKWAKRFAADSFVTVLVREDQPRVLAGSSRGETQMELALVKAATELHANDKTSSWAALTAFSGFPQASAAHEHLASAWVRAVGGGLERGPRRSAGAVEEILAANRALQPLVNKWHRSLEDVRSDW